jgi:hypothetical protein
VADYDLRCPFCGTPTVDGRCPSCAQAPERTTPSGISAERSSAHVDVPASQRSSGSVDRLAIYTPEGGRPGTFARAATLLAASISVVAFVVLVVALLVGLGAALFGAATATSGWLSALLLMLSVVLAGLLAICATGLSIVWRHRGDYEAARDPTSSSR